MDGISKELERMVNGASIGAVVDDVDQLLQRLEEARDAIINDPNSASTVLTKLQNPVKQHLDQALIDLKKVHQGQVKFTKALDQRFPVKPLPIEHDALAPHTHLIARAIAMHFLREGQFDVASTFLNEAHKAFDTGSPNTDFTSDKSRQLQDQFTIMYSILRQLKEKDLAEAITWARAHSQQLAKLGSNLEFDLIKLQYISLFLEIDNGVDAAIHYARENFPRFKYRYMYDIQRLSAAIAYRANIRQSPYRDFLADAGVWDAIATSFTKDFCSLLGLAAESPLYVAVTAGAIALPVFEKLAKITKEKHTEWTTADELPVEIPLPDHFKYHAIFVCPVSKEQSTEANPPMMMPCGHVVAKESLSRISRGSRYKCPYCPMESSPKDAVQIYL